VEEEEEEEEEERKTDRQKVSFIPIFIKQSKENRRRTGTAYAT
jgi:hypothetical protein